MVTSKKLWSLLQNLKKNTDPMSNVRYFLKKFRLRRTFLSSLVYFIIFVTSTSTCFIRAKKGHRRQQETKKNVDLLLPPKEERESEKERKSSHTYTHSHTAKSAHTQTLTFITNPQYTAVNSNFIPVIGKQLNIFIFCDFYVTFSPRLFHRHLLSQFSHIATSFRDFF